MSRSPIPARRALALASVLLLALLAAPALIANAAAHDNNVQWTELGHNSRDPLFRAPGGAAPTGMAVRLRLRAADGDLTAAQVRVWDDRNDQQSLIPMTRTTGGVTFAGDPAVYEFWEVTLPAPADPTIFYYRFIAIDGSTTVFYEDDNARTGGWGQTFDSSPDNSWQLTYYDPAFQTPDWVKNAVIYQIFPDRFRDGNSANNPAAGEFRFAGQVPDHQFEHPVDAQLDLLAVDLDADRGQVLVGKGVAHEARDQAAFADSEIAEQADLARLFSHGRLPSIQRTPAWTRNG